MHRWRGIKSHLIFCLSCSLFLAFISCRQESNQEILRVAVAANAKYALEELAAGFREVSGTEVELVVSSSGKLTAQIEQGAPYHLFFSADMKYPRYLESGGLAATPPRLYAKGQLVYWTMRDTSGWFSNVDMPSLLLGIKGKIAVAQPDLAPYGAAARAFLNSQNVWEALADRLVFGENVSQVNQYVLAGAASGGFTAKSVVLAPDLSGKGYWREIDERLYPPIDQGVIITKVGANGPLRECEAFLQYLQSENGRDILLNFGYLIPGKGE